MKWEQIFHAAEVSHDSRRRGRPIKHQHQLSDLHDVTSIIDAPMGSTLERDAYLPQGLFQADTGLRPVRQREVRLEVQMTQVVRRKCYMVSLTLLAEEVEVKVTP